MRTIEQILFQLSNTFITETMIPDSYIFFSEIQEAIRKYNWTIRPSMISSWVSLVRQINYSS